MGDDFDNADREEDDEENGDGEPDEGVETAEERKFPPPLPLSTSVACGFSFLPRGGVFDRNRDILLEIYLVLGCKKRFQ